MPTHDELLQEFRTIRAEGKQLPEDSVASRQITVLQQLEGAADPKVTQFLVKVMTSPDEIDLVRIEAATILRVYPLHTTEERRVAGRAIADLVLWEPDILVRQYVAMATESYCDVPGVFDAAAQVILDRSVDLDVRYNCLNAIEQAGKSDRTVQILTTLRADPGFAETAACILSEWHVA
jgi:hypothetical protein